MKRRFVVTVEDCARELDVPAKVLEDILINVREDTVAIVGTAPLIMPLKLYRCEYPDLRAK